MRVLAGSSSVRFWIAITLVPLLVGAWGLAIESALRSTFSDAWFVVIVPVVAGVAGLYRAVGRDPEFSPDERGRIRRRLLFFGPAAAAELLLVLYRRQNLLRRAERGE